MNHVTSRASLATSASQKSLASASTSPSLFETILPQEAENIETHLPRGMRFALSPQLVGHGKVADVLKQSAKTYNVTIEPHGRRGIKGDMIKEFLKYGDVEAPTVDFGLELPKVRFGDAVQDSIVDERYERSIFRKERLRKFNLHRHIPALVTPRLVPFWRGSLREQTNKQSPAQEAQARIEEALRSLYVKKRKHKRNIKSAKYNTIPVVLTPTVSTAQKRQNKVEPEPPNWQIGSVASAHEIMHPTYDAFEGEGSGTVADEMKEKEFKEYQENKERWLSNTMLPAGKTPSRGSQQIAEVREKGKANLQSLRNEYQQKLDKFQLKQKKRQESGEKSSFQRYWAEYKKQERLEKEAAERTVEDKPSGPLCANLGGLLSLGLSKHRATQSDVGFLSSADTGQGT
mmetsp:Transcript_103507/g.179761  ORF Transcript_103507/g.179761 Transcript_103507/m.179761 type:complete len:402 (-) Transcript_103507:98-1303(-)